MDSYPISNVSADIILISHVAFWTFLGKVITKSQNIIFQGLQIQDEFSVVNKTTLVYFVVNPHNKVVGKGD